MSKNGKAASQHELQAIADICLSVVECYSTEDFFVPNDITLPLRFSSVPECKSIIRLWVRDNHCVALVESQSMPLIQNVFDESSLLQAVSCENDRDLDSDIRTDRIIQQRQNQSLLLVPSKLDKVEV